MDTLWDSLCNAVQNSAIPHYKEDAFRTLIAWVALEQGWAIAEPRPFNARLIPKGKAAVYFLSRQDGQLKTEPTFVDALGGTTKPDVRLFSPTQTFFVGEIKTGLTGSASEVNSNSTKIADDIDLVAAGQRHFFLGLFDEGMFERIQGRLSSAGRGSEMRKLWGNSSMSKIQEGPGNLDVDSDWNMVGMRATIRTVVGKCGTHLALVLVRRRSG